MNLAALVGGDLAEIDRLVRVSPRMTAKWDSRRGGTTWGARTVVRAVGFWRDRQSITQSGTAQATPTQDIISQTAAGPPVVGGFAATDFGNMERFAARFGRQVAWNAPWGWLVYSGTHWKRDIGLPTIRALGADTIRTMYQTASEIADQQDRVRLAKWALECETRHRLESMLSLAEMKAHVPIDVFDRDGYLLNCRNGTLHLRTRALRPHRPDDRMTRCTRARYDPAADAPRWIRFLDEIMAGDAGAVAFLQQVAGLGCLGVALEHIVVILWGAGFNGKSCWMNALGYALGDYAKVAKPGAFSHHQPHEA